MVETQHSFFRFPIRVYFEDTDAGGVVYHASYVRFYERARTEWLRTQGYAQTTLLNQQRGFVVVTMQLEYIKPARLDDLLEIDIAFNKVGNASVSLVQNTWRRSTEHASSPTERINQAQIKLVFTDLRAMKPIAIPDEWRAKFSGIQNPPNLLN